MKAVNVRRVLEKIRALRPIRTVEVVRFPSRRGSLLESIAEPRGVGLRVPRWARKPQGLSSDKKRWTLEVEPEESEEAFLERCLAQLDALEKAILPPGVVAASTPEIREEVLEMSSCPVCKGGLKVFNGFAWKKCPQCLGFGAVGTRVGTSLLEAFLMEVGELPAGCEVLTHGQGNFFLRIDVGADAELAALICGIVRKTGGSS